MLFQIYFRQSNFIINLIFVNYDCYILYFHIYTKDLTMAAAVHPPQFPTTTHDYYYCSSATTVYFDFDNSIGDIRHQPISYVK
jgi:hypothetical protein